MQEVTHGADNVLTVLETAVTGKRTGSSAAPPYNSNLPIHSEEGESPCEIVALSETHADGDENVINNVETSKAPEVATDRLLDEQERTRLRTRYQQLADNARVLRSRRPDTKNFWLTDRQLAIIGDLFSEAWNE